MRVYLGSDHAGFELKTHLVAELSAAGHETIDVGPPSFDPEDDYPAYCLATAAMVVGDPGSLGVVIGGSGNGEQIAANKVPGVRAALAWSAETAALAREHNDANVISIGSRMHSADEATALVTAFLGTAFSDEQRHVRRIGQVSDYERTHRVPQLPPTT
ncbi:MAG: ribose-5-phosphate isomerase [Actinomycetota bacterium]|jgi:ribose 5-phosphate isomerase B|nr:ribose-5-phosphate isomerase [Actinomycetota bacterium]